MRTYKVTQPNLKSFMAVHKKMYPHKYFLLTGVTEKYLTLIDISKWTFKMIFEKSLPHFHYPNLYVTKRLC